MAPFVQFRPSGEPYPVPSESYLALPSAITSPPSNYAAAPPLRGGAPGGEIIGADKGYDARLFS